MLLKNVEAYISELLFEHDCVILPTFGGFVARGAAAHFIKTGNMLMPPSKSIVFNKNLTNNDGLLAGYIMQKENAGYPQAIMIIENFVTHCKQQLDQHKRYELNGVGILYKNAENTILFEQDNKINHHIFSFGLPAVHAIKRVVKEEKVIDVKPQLQYRTNTNQRVKQPVQKPVRRIVAATIIAFGIVSTMFLVTHQNPVQSVEATLNPFKKSISTVSEKAPKLIPSTEEKAIIKPDIDTVKIDKTAVVKSAETIVEWYKKPYQVVVGCFSVKENAFKLINQLSQQNLQAEIAGQNAKNLYIVSVAGFSDESDARTKLVQIKEQYPAAWLLKK